MRPSSSAADADRSPTWLLPACLVAVTALAALPLLTTGGEPLLAWRGAEVWGHTWTWWWHGLALPGWPAGTDLATGTSSWPVIDLLPALAGATVSRVAGAVLAWNLMALLAIAGAFAGGWWLARRVGGSGPVGGLALAMAPIFTGSLLSGLSEDMAIGLLAVAVGLVVVPQRPADQTTGAQDVASPESRARGSGLRAPLPWRWAIATGLCLGLLAWCGPYLAWLGALTALVAGLAHLIREPRSWLRWLVAGLGAGILALPPLLAQGARATSGAGHRAGAHLGGTEPLWIFNPWGQADLASFLTPGITALPADAVIRLHPGYLGLGVLLLALAAGRSRWWWLLLAGLLLAPGEQLHWLGRATAIPNPFGHAIDWLPGGELLNHHARLLMLGQVGLAALAALGAARLAHRWRRGALVATAAAALVVLDYGLAAPVGWPLPAAQAQAPDFLAELGALAPGPLLWLPAGGPGLSPQRPLLDQRVHGRPLALDPNRPGAPPWLPRTPLGRWLTAVTAAPPQPTLGPAALDPLLERGVAVLAVAAPHDRSVAALLGPADIQGDDGAAWDLALVAGRISSRGAAETQESRGDGQTPAERGSHGGTEN